MHFNGHNSFICRYYYARKKKDVRLLQLIDGMKDTLFDIISKNQVFRCHEDKIFYEDQKTGRKFTIGGLDKKDSRKINANEERRRRDKRRRDEKDDEWDKQMKPNGYKIDVDDDYDNDNNHHTEEWCPPPKKIKLDVLVTLNKRHWLDNVAAVADKVISSNRSALQIAVAAVSSSSEAHHLSFSEATLRRRRQRTRRDIAKIVRDELQSEIQENHTFLLHWDEKVLKGRRQVDGSSEYMAIVLTNLTTGNCLVRLL